MLAVATHTSIHQPTTTTSTRPTYPPTTWWWLAVWWRESRGGRPKRLLNLIEPPSTNSTSFPYSPYTSSCTLDSQLQVLSCVQSPQQTMLSWGEGGAVRTQDGSGSRSAVIIITISSSSVVGLPTTVIRGHLHMSIVIVFYFCTSTTTRTR